jgi:hypothetical protein
VTFTLEFGQPFDLLTELPPRGPIEQPEGLHPVRSRASHDPELPCRRHRGPVDEVRNAGIEFEQYDQGPIKTNEEGIATP